MSRELPLVGAWYRHIEHDQNFEIVAFDEEEEMIGIQYENGDLAELDLDTWQESRIIAIDTPEEWDGPYEDTELSDDDRVSRRRHAMNDGEEGWEEEALADEESFDEDEET